MHVIIGNRNKLISKSSFLFQLEKDVLQLQLAKFVKVGFLLFLLSFLDAAGAWSYDPSATYGE